MKYAYILIGLCLFCCKEKNTRDKIEDYLTSFEIQKPKNVLIIHLDGCTGCFLEHKALVEKANALDSYEIILVTKSKKKAEILFGEELANRIIFDTNLLAIESGLVTGFPMVFSFDKDGRFIEQTQIDYSSKDQDLP